MFTFLYLIDAVISGQAGLHGWARKLCIQDVQLHDHLTNLATAFYYQPQCVSYVRK